MEIEAHLRKLECGQKDGRPDRQTLRSHKQFLTMLESVKLSILINVLL